MQNNNNLYNLDESIESKSQNDIWVKLLYYLIMDTYSKNEMIWNDFCHKIKNQEFSQHKIIKILDQIKEECASWILPQTKLYRARKLKYNELKSIYYNKSCFKNLYKQIKDLLPNEHVEEDFNLNMFGFLKHILKLNDYEKAKSIFNQWLDDNKELKFWGFSKKDSGTNFSDDSSAGRLNKKDQHHFYAAFDIETAITEVQPILNQSVSVADIEILKKLKVLDLTINLNWNDENNFGKNTNISFISEQCSKPCFNDTDFYEPTQFLSNYIKDAGFDGIIYSSSLNKNGRNIIIFDTQNIEYDMDKINATYHILSSKLYNITNISIEKQQMLLFQDDKT